MTKHTKHTTLEEAQDALYATDADIGYVAIWDHLVRTTRESEAFHSLTAFVGRTASDGRKIQANATTLDKLVDEATAEWHRQKELSGTCTNTCGCENCKAGTHAL